MMITTRRTPKIGISAKQPAQEPNNIDDESVDAFQDVADPAVSK